MSAVESSADFEPAAATAKAVVSASPPQSPSAPNFMLLTPALTSNQVCGHTIARSISPESYFPAELCIYLQSSFHSYFVTSCLQFRDLHQREGNTHRGEAAEDSPLGLVKSEAPSADADADEPHHQTVSGHQLAIAQESRSGKTPCFRSNRCKCSVKSKTHFLSDTC